MKEKLTVSEKAEKLHIKLFSEEYDNQFDSYSDAQDRANGINPMNTDYQAKINNKREKLGVIPLSKNGLPKDDSAMQLCINEVKASLNNQATNYTLLITQFLKEKENKEAFNKVETDYFMKYAPGIDTDNPYTWTEVMIENLYKLEEATDRWELDSTMSYAKFKELIFTDSEFRRSHIPRVAMASDDYNPLDARSI